MKAMTIHCSQCGDTMKIEIGWIPFDVDVPCPKCGKVNRIAVKFHES